MGKLTISAAEEILSKHGFMLRTTKTQGQEPSNQSRVIFKQDTGRSRDLEIKEQALSEIMENRKVSREQAEAILSNPF